MPALTERIRYLDDMTPGLQYQVRIGSIGVSMIATYDSAYGGGRLMFRDALLFFGANCVRESLVIAAWDSIVCWEIGEVE